ncbi:hypothetical protein AT959_12240 [Dechloromonas denitrificans]|uniref:Glycosyl transferase family 1 domain-containing protein n=1 Tax=Dechloromonas denitrificans TaxID=281362 RepID=A0A133XGS2_9RHOO|nr:glycosyltransferase [Dechloromonas denitrificans]KXB30137.1 hypothetical protein AT959_12240 [Dechloromonas denitrificans]
MANLLLSRGHEVICLFSEAFQEGLADLRADIISNAPGVRVASFHVPSPCAACAPDNAWRQMAARMLREHAIACLEPEFVHVPALLADGWGDDAIGSIGVLGVRAPTSLTQYDLIPLVMSDIYMPPGAFRDYYMKKLEGVKQADLLLAISEYSQREAIEWLGMQSEDIVHISFAADSKFAEEPAGGLHDVERTVSKYGLRPGYLLYAPGGFDARKNMDRLLEAYSLLPEDVRGRHQLAIASKLHEGVRAGIEWKAGTFGVQASEIVLMDYVPDEDLMHLYRACHAYVFPSLHEGFGLPALEAMFCGAPVIASNCTSIPEVMEMDEALFDPYDPQSMAAKILQVIHDPDFRQRLIAHAAIQPHKFSWATSAELAVSALERKHAALKNAGWHSTPVANLPTCEDMLARLAKLVANVQPSEEDLELFRACLKANLKAKCI